MTDEELLEQAQEHWSLCDDHYSEQYQESTDDWEFLHGIGQWDQGAENTRKKEGRPCLTLNQLLPYAHQITNDIKQARLAIRVVPVDSKADIETAEIRAGIIRNIEKQSRAKSVYGTAAMNAIGGGLGWIRVTTDYASPDSFDQEAYLKRVLDFTSVRLDPQSVQIDGSDAEYGFVQINYSKQRFEELYPDHNPVSFESLSSDDEVCIVEYYYRECKKETLYEIELFDGTIEQVLGSRLKDLEENGLQYEEKRSREVEIYTVWHCVLNGEGSIEEKSEFPSQYIPLVPVVGEEVYIDGKRQCHSLIRQAKDAQRMYNYLKSENVNVMALQPKTPWVAPIGSFQSHPDKWANANTKNYAFLEYDVVTDDETGMPLPPPQRTPPIQGSAAMMQEAMSAREDIRLGLGVPQSNMGERSNAVSGIAIRNQQIEGDNATFHFIDNLSSSIAQVGRILNEIIPVLYSERKIQRIVGDNDEEENIVVNTPYIKGEDGLRPAKGTDTPDGIYDLSVGKYDIDMDVGASYSSKRQETADKLNEMMKIQPELISVIGDLAVEALDIPMAKEIAERLRSQMSPDLLGDDPQAAKLQAAGVELKKMQEQLLNYEAALADKSKNEQFEQSLEAEKAQLERDKFMVEAEKTKADIQKIYAEIGKQDQESNIEAIMGSVHELQQTIEIILDAKEREGNEAASEPESD